VDLVFVLDWPWHVELPVSVIFLGAIVGLSYGLLATGLVLVYRAQRIINLAHAQLGVIGSAVLAYCKLQLDLPWAVAAAIGIAVAALVGVTVERTVLRRLADAPRVIVLVATIGAAQLFVFLAYLILKAIDDRGLAFPLPFDDRVAIGKYLVLTDTHLLILRVIPPVAVLVAVVLRFTSFGLAVRASAENADAAKLAGIPTRRVAMGVWAIAGALAAVSSICLAPDKGLALTDTLGPELLVRALAAAVLARMVHLGRAFLAGILIGVLEQLVFWNSSNNGVTELALFLVILVAFALQTRRREGSRSDERSSWELTRLMRPMPSRLQADRRVRAAGWLGLGAVMGIGAVVPFWLSSSQTFLLTGIVTLAMLAVSVSLLTGTSGQISLGQVAFLGLGAAIAYQVVKEHSVPFLPAVLVAGAAGALAAVAIGLPALRRQGLFLAVTTLAFALVAQKWMLQRDWMAGVGATLHRPEVLGVSFRSQHAFYLVALAGLLLAMLLARSVLSGPLGRTMVAVRDNERQAAALGVDTTRVKLLAFAVSGFIAAAAGALYGYGAEQFSPDSFPVADGLRIVSVAVIGGLGSISGTVLAALLVFGVDRLVDVAEIRLMMTALGLLLILMFLPSGFAGPLARARDWAASKIARPHPTGNPTPDPTPDREPGGERGSDARRTPPGSRGRGERAVEVGA
jgi:ABC-type branched-subunit amino acid transport system permease subunit